MCGFLIKICQGGRKNETLWHSRTCAPRAALYCPPGQSRWPISLTGLNWVNTSFFLHPGRPARQPFSNGIICTHCRSSGSLPILLNFEEYKDYTPSEFYDSLYEDIREEIENGFQKREAGSPKALNQFLEIQNSLITFYEKIFFTKFARF